MFYMEMSDLQVCWLDHLAARAKMGAALRYNNSLDRCAAGKARFTRALIDLEMILKITPAVNPIDARAVAPDAFTQDFPNRVEQPRGLVSRERAGFLQRVNACPVQGFIGVNIPQTADKTLVH